MRRMHQNVRPLPFRRAAHLLVSTWVVVALAGCGGDSPNQPSPNPGGQAPTVTAVDPRGGTTVGGTTVTITGTNFAAGAIVTVGGTPATDVAVQGPTSLTARTPQHPSGQADVVVTVGGRSGTLRNGFLFEPPSASANQPPTISGISSRSARAGAPGAFADLDDTLQRRSPIRRRRPTSCATSGAPTPARFPAPAARSRGGRPRRPPRQPRCV
jgi:hypothetical protein